MLDWRGVWVISAGLVDVDLCLVVVLVECEAPAVCWSHINTRLLLLASLIPALELALSTPAPVHSKTNMKLVIISPA